MILPFSTQINGKPNLFIERIWKGLLRNVCKTDAAYVAFGNLYEQKFGNYWDEFPEEHSRMEYPKIHTIREDVNDRWHAGRDIHFTINNRSKNSFRFAPVLPCLSTQEVYMVLCDASLEISIAINGKWLSSETKLILAKQDGFDTLEEFEQYFIEAIEKTPQKCAIFKLIHWTNFKY